jgi:nucleoid-associated protein YgaU
MRGWFSRSVRHLQASPITTRFQTSVRRNCGHVSRSRCTTSYSCSIERVSEMRWATWVGMPGAGPRGGSCVTPSWLTDPGAERRREAAGARLGRSRANRSVPAAVGPVSRRQTVTVTTDDRLVVDNAGHAGRSTWLDLNGPSARMVFVGREPAADDRADGSDVEAPRASVTLLDRGYRPGVREAAADDRVMPVRRRPVRRTGSRVASACADTAGPTLHGARLTRRGRVVVVLAWVVLVAIAAVPVVRTVGGEPAPVPITETVRVGHGDTVWDIARAADPTGDAREVVSTIVELNELDSVTDIRAGDRLVVPAAP